MALNHDPDPGGGTSLSSNSFAAVTKEMLSSTTPASGGGSNNSSPSRLRSFAEILNEEKLHRNILEVKISKTYPISDESVTVRPLSESDLSEFLFDVIKLKVEDCLGLALRTYRYDTKEIKLKSDVDPSLYITSSPVMFKGHSITIMKQSNNVSKVTFRNVPFNIPDEEIIHLCKVYGEPVNDKVYYEKATRFTKGIPGSTRYVEVKLNPGKQFENFYWMEGPLNGDQGCRITVLHSGQTQQCSHCLKREDLCPGGGNGKTCNNLKTAPSRISDYMKFLRVKHGYVSLKMEYLQMQFPALGKSDSEAGFGHMVELQDVETDIEVKEQNFDKNLFNEQQSDINNQCP